MRRVKLMLQGKYRLRETIQQTEISFPAWVCPVIDHDFRHNVIKVAVDPR